MTWNSARMLLASALVIALTGCGQPETSGQQPTVLATTSAAPLAPTVAPTAPPAIMPTQPLATTAAGRATTAPTEASASPAPAATDAPTAAAELPAATRIAPFPQKLLTPEAAELEQRDNMFRIYGVGPAGEPNRQSPRQGEQYQRDVVGAVARDLAQRQGVAAESITIVSVSETELTSGGVCGPSKTESAVPAERAPAVEVVAEANGMRFRYVAAGALGYYCGESAT